MKIVELHSENVKRLSAVNIKPDGSIVVIGGRNGQGKSSVLDSIMYALAGGESLPSKPLRNGTDAGQIVVDLGEMTVTRKFTRDAEGEVRSTLEVKAKNGFKASSPQKLLNDMCGKMAFDPLEFSRMRPKQQLDALKELVGLDFTDDDRERANVFQCRSDVNRSIRAKQSELQACPLIEDAPAQEVSAADLLAELEKRQEHNRAKSSLQAEIQDAEQGARVAASQAKACQVRIEELERQLAQARQELVELGNEKQLKLGLAAELQAGYDAMPTMDCDDIHQQIRDVDRLNAAVRQNAKRAALAESVKSLEAEAETLTGRIKAIDDAKAAKMAAAPFPVTGLGFDADGITLNGLPFEQASSAEQLRVSVAMGIALNPKLRVMLIRDGSLLDEDSLALVATMAEEADAQIWIERVSDGDEVSVVIEDGHVRDEAVASAAQVEGSEEHY